MCCSPSALSCGSVMMVARSYRVLMSDGLCTAVCVGFLYILILMLLSSFFSCPGMIWICLFPLHGWILSFLCGPFDSCVQSVSLSFSDFSLKCRAYRFRKLILHCGGAVCLVLISRSSVKNPLVMADSGSPCFCVYIVSWDWKQVEVATKCNICVMLCTVSAVRLYSVLSCLSRMSTMINVTSTGVLVKSDRTSCDISVSSVCTVMTFNSSANCFAVLV